MINLISYIVNVLIVKWKIELILKESEMYGRKL